MNSRETTTRAFARTVHKQVLVILPIVLATVLTSGSTTIHAAEDDMFTVPSGMERAYLSLRTLSKQVKQSLDEKTPLSAEVRTLCGIAYSQGYIVDESGEKDIILIGLRSKKQPSSDRKGRPSLRLDDLIVNMRNVGTGVGYPLCSLNPRPENIRALQAFGATPRAVTPSGLGALSRQLQKILGPQEVVVGGVPRNSRHAHIMIDADYHMKKVCQGHVVLPNVNSYLDHYLAKSKLSPGMSLGMARFWFHVAPDTPTYQEGKGIIWLDQCPVVVLTEKQETSPSGTLYDVKEDDPIAVAFKADFSREFPKSTARVPVYADLENLFRLRALLLAMEFRGSLRAVGMDPRTFLSEYEYQDETPMSDSLPGLVNHKLPKRGSSYFPIVCGGVGMDMRVDEPSFSDKKSARLFQFRMSVLLARPSKDSLVWVIPAES